MLNALLQLRLFAELAARLAREAIARNDMDTDGTQRYQQQPVALSKQTSGKIGSQEGVVDGME